MHVMFSVPRGADVAQSIRVALYTPNWVGFPAHRRVWSKDSIKDVPVCSVHMVYQVGNNHKLSQIHMARRRYNQLPLHAIRSSPQRHHGNQYFHIQLLDFDQHLENPTYFPSLWILRVHICIGLPIFEPLQPSHCPTAENN